MTVIDFQVRSASTQVLYTSTKCARLKPEPWCMTSVPLTHTLPPSLKDPSSSEAHRRLHWMSTSRLFAEHERVAGHKHVAEHKHEHEHVAEHKHANMPPTPKYKKYADIYNIKTMPASDPTKQMLERKRYIYIYMYIYRERERERKRGREKCMSIYKYMFIYIQLLLFFL